MSDNIIEVNNLSKRYLLGASTGDGHLRELLVDGVKNFGKIITGKKKIGTPREEFWALKDVSFNVKQGEVVGIIGRNGAGKSTLLKLLSRITDPTSGFAKINGRVGSLLEVGTGFHPELSGRENIFLNGAILGMTKKEIKQSFDSIVDFSEIEKFIDTPVKRYSSGMYVRLAFAVAAHLEPEVLIVDEVLAVGDAAFQKKCLGKMKDVAAHGKTILFVSHNMGAVQSLCTRGILIGNGEKIYDGSSEEAVRQYLGTISKSSEQSLADRTDRNGAGNTRMIDVIVSADEKGSVITSGGQIKIEFVLTNILPALNCGFTIYNSEGIAITHLTSAVACEKDIHDPSVGTKIVCQINQNLLLPGEYRINAKINSGEQLEDHVEGVVSFRVESGVVSQRPINQGNGYGVVTFDHQWILPN